MHWRFRCHIKWCSLSGIVIEMNSINPELWYNRTERHCPSPRMPSGLYVFANGSIWHQMWHHLVVSGAWFIEIWVNLRCSLLAYEQWYRLLDILERYSLALGPGSTRPDLSRVRRGLYIKKSIQWIQSEEPLLMEEPLPWAVHVMHLIAGTCDDEWCGSMMSQSLS